MVLLELRVTDSKIEHSLRTFPVASSYVLLQSSQSILKYY